MVLLTMALSIITWPYNLIPVSHVCGSVSRAPGGIEVSRLRIPQSPIFVGCPLHLQRVDGPRGINMSPDMPGLSTPAPPRPRMKKMRQRRKGCLSPTDVKLPDW
jgi:hypothetical protein